MLDEGLRAVPFLRGLPTTAVASIAQRLTDVALGAGEALFRAGDTSDAVYIVRTGRVVVVEATTGTVLAGLGPGGVLGETGVLLDMPRTADVVGVDDAELWRLDRLDLERVIDDHPQVGVALGREVGRHLLNADERRSRPPPRVVVVASPGVAGLADAIVAEGVDRVGVLDLGGGFATAAPLPAGVAVVPPSLADPEALTAFATDPVDEVAVLAVALPERPDHVALTAVGLAHNAVDLVRPLPKWAATVIDPLRHLAAPRTPAELRRLARWVSGRAVGLALSSGGSKTIAHVGVLKVLLEAGVPIDAVAGTSGGSIVASGLATGMDHQRLVECVRELPEAFRYRRLGARVPPRDGLFTGPRLVEMFRRWFGPGDIADTDVPLFVVTADVRDGSEVVLRRGPIATAVRASMGIPGVFTPIAWYHHWLTDGGIVTPLPTRVLRDAGLGIVLASNVAGQQPPPSDDAGSPGIVETLGTMVATMERQVLAPQVAMADVTIRPVVRADNSLDFKDIDAHLAEGERAATEALDRIASVVDGTA